MTCQAGKINKRSNVKRRNSGTAKGVQKRIIFQQKIKKRLFINFTINEKPLIRREMSALLLPLSFRGQITSCRPSKSAFHISGWAGKTQYLLGLVRYELYTIEYKIKKRLAKKLAL